MIERTYISYWKDDIQCPDCGRYGRLDQFTGGIRDGCYVRALVCHGCYVQARRKLKRHKERICQNPACGITFTTTRTDAKFCSNACRQKAHRGKATAAA